MGYEFTFLDCYQLSWSAGPNTTVNHIAHLVMLKLKLLMLLIFSGVLLYFLLFYDNLSGNFYLLFDVVYFSFMILDIQQVPVLLPSAQISLTGRI